MSSSSPYAPTAGQPIPTPEDFPVSWENPGDAKLTWQLDTHVTEPMAPLSCSVAAAILRGFNPALGQVGLPIHMRIRFTNGFPYAAVVPTAAPPEAMMKVIGAVNRLVLQRDLVRNCPVGAAAVSGVRSRLDSFGLGCTG